VIPLGEYNGAGLRSFASAANETWRDSTLIAARHSEPSFAAVDWRFTSLFVLGKLRADADPLVSAAGIFRVNLPNVPPEKV